MQALKPFTRSSIETVQYLVERKGAKCDTQDVKGRTALVSLLLVRLTMLTLSKASSGVHKLCLIPRRKEQGRT